MRRRRFHCAQSSAITVLWLATLGLGLGCERGQSTSRVRDGRTVGASAVGDSSADRRVIEKALNDWALAYNSKDLAGVMGIWSREFIGWFYGAPEFGYRDAEQGYANGFADTSVSRTYTLTIDEIQVFGEMGVARITFHQTETRSRQVSRTNIKSMQVWAHESDGAWRIVRTVSFPQAVP